MAARPEPVVFEITRRYEQPLARVWKAWTEAAELERWWGPKGCAIEVLRFEFRPGGFCHYAMTFEQAPTWWGRFAYREIVTHERLVWLNAFANEYGGIARAPFSDECPLEIQNAVSFSERGGVTTVHLQASPFGAVDVERRYFDALRPSLEEGYGGTLEQLGAHLARS